MTSVADGNLRAGDQRPVSVAQRKAEAMTKALRRAEWRDHLRTIERAQQFVSSLDAHLDDGGRTTVGTMRDLMIMLVNVTDIALHHMADTKVEDR
jgi:hypothetical protein